MERRKILHEHFHPVEGEFGFAQSSDGSSSEQIAEFLDDSIKDGCEGLMVKRLTTEDSTYEPSRRSINWLKVSNMARSWLERNSPLSLCYPAEEGLSCRRGRFLRFGRCRWILR